MSRWPATQFIERNEQVLASLGAFQALADSSRRSVKVGRVRTCRIEPKALSLAEHWINQGRAEWEQHFDQLGEYLSTLVKRGIHAKYK